MHAYAQSVDAIAHLPAFIRFQYFVILTIDRRCVVARESTLRFRLCLESNALDGI